jgi:hypothetical protein
MAKKQIVNVYKRADDGSKIPSEILQGKTIQSLLTDPDNRMIWIEGMPFGNSYVSTKDDENPIHSEVFNDFEHNVALGDYSHAEGYVTKAFGNNSHAEGQKTEAQEVNSHAEGYNTIASGYASHAEGSETVASGDYSHTEGYDTRASGTNSHSEGCATLSEGNNSHAEGNMTEALGESSHSEGYETNASGKYSHAEGQNTEALGEGSHSEGYETIANGDASHVEGYKTYTEQNYSHAEGQETYTDGVAAHAEGYRTKAEENYSHAEGYKTIAKGTSSHAEGCETEAQGDNSHTEGFYTTAAGNCSHAEGSETIASGDYSHTEGNSTEASGIASHAGGNCSNASTLGSFVHGNSLIVSNDYEVSFGQYNETLSTVTNETGAKTIFSVGIGTDDENRKNALNIRENGAVYIYGINNDLATILQKDEAINYYTCLLYNDLIELIKNEQLIPNAFYRIIDFRTSVNVSHLTTENIQYDIIVKAISKNTIYDTAILLRHQTNIDRSMIYSNKNLVLEVEDQKTYRITESNILFNDISSNIDLSKYFVKYSLRNDNNRYTWTSNYSENNYNKALIDGVEYIFKDGSWKDAENNTVEINPTYNQITWKFTGVIYDMVDEFGNRCPYDFKSIKFVDPSLALSSKFTFNSPSGTDASNTGKCLHNIIGDFHDNDGNLKIAFNTFNQNTDTDRIWYNVISSESSNNEFYGDCIQNTICGECSKNKFINSSYNVLNTNCTKNTLDSSENNILKSSCEENYIKSSNYNELHESCKLNKFYSQADNNILHIRCTENKLYEKSSNNVLGATSSNNEFYEGSTFNSIGDNCTFNIFEKNSYRNCLGSNSSKNIFKSFTNDSTQEITACTYNILGKNCADNILNFGCNSNKFGDNCNENVLESYCSFNTFGNECDNNKIMDNSIYNSFADYCKDNILGQYNKYNIFEQNCRFNTFVSLSSKIEDPEIINYNSLPIKSYCHYNQFKAGCCYNIIMNDLTGIFRNIIVRKGVSGLNDKFPNFIHVQSIEQDYETEIGFTTTEAIGVQQVNMFDFASEKYLSTIFDSIFEI